MKKIFFPLLLTFCLVLPFTSAQARVDFTFARPINLDSTPLDIATNLDGSLIYVLAEGGKLLVYSATGKLEQSYQVDPSMDHIDATGLKVARIPDRLFLSSSKSKQVQAVSVDFIVEINTSGAPFKGPEHAPVVMTVFSDFECPACAQFSRSLTTILEKNPDTVKFVFKHFPLPNHSKARPAAWASVAAHNQGKFWEYHDLLFGNQRSLSQEKYEEFAVQLGLDLEKFKTDMTSLDTKQKVSDDYNEGRNIPVTATPTIYINGKIVQNRSIIQQMIESELARLNQQK